MCLQSDDVVQRLPALGPPVLPLLPRLHIVFQGREAAGVAIHSGRGAVLVVLLVLSPPGDALLVVGLQHRRADGNHGRCGGGGPATSLMPGLGPLGFEVLTY